MILRDIFKKPVISEGGNLASHTAAGEPTVGWAGVPGNYNAGKIDSKNRAAMQPAVKQLLVDINNLFTRQYGRPIWSPELVEKEVETFISGSSKWFMQLRQPNPNFNPQQPPSDVNPKEIGVADKDFQRVKQKVGDIDTQIDRRLEPQIEEFLHKNIGANIGSATLLGTKKGSDQWLALWQLHEPPITLQVDLEFSDYTTDARGFEIPTEWAQVSHGSAWEDLELGIKGVFRQTLYRSIAKVAPTEKYIAKMAGAGKNKGMKLFGGDDGKEPVVDLDNPPPPLHDANFSFAVASVGGGGVRAKYRQPTAQENVPLEINGVPVMVPLTPAESEYIKDMSSQFEQFFGVPAKANETKMMASLVGTVELMKQFFTPDQQQIAVQEFLKINFGKGAQMIDSNDPTSDFKTKMTAIDYVLDQTGMQNLRKQALQMAKDYETAFNAKKQPQPLAEAEVKAQLRKGMPHLHDLKPSDLLDLLDEIHDGNGNFKLQNIPLNVKIDGFGGRFGKNAEGKPFMGTSRTEPRYQAGFVAYHKQKGTTDPEILGRAQLFDQLFNEMMNAIQLVDGKLGPDFLVNKQVTCEVLYLPFATETPEGKLKFVGIHYDKLPDGVHLALVPFRVVDATTGEDLPDSNKFIKELLKVGSSGSVMFIDNSLTQNEGLDVTALVPPLENIEQMKAMLASKKRDQAAEVKAALEPVKAALEKAIIEDPNIIGKDLLGQDYEGIVINSRLGPIKVTSQEQRDVITAKNAAKATARTERPRGEAKTAVVAIGSFIGHKGHEELFNYTINKAKEVGGDPYLFIGNAEGKDDPIPPAVKVQTWHKLYPQYAQNISTVQAGGALIQKVKHELINPLPGKPPRYDNIVIMVGEDRAGMNMPNALMKAVNKFQGYEHVKVSLEVTPRGTGISGTALRNSLKSEAPEKALATWSNAFDVQKLGAEWIKHLMDITRKGMGIQEPQQPVQQQQPVPVAEHRLLNALIRPEKTENRLDEFDLFKKSAPMKTPASKPGASSAEMRKFFQNQANKDKPGLKPKSVDMDNPQKVYTKHAEEEIEDNDAMSRMARDLTGPGAPDAKRRAQRDQQRQQDRAQSDGRDHGPKWDVEEGEQDPQSELKMINQKLKDAYKHVRNNSSVSIGWYMSQVKELNARREELIKQLRQGMAEGEYDSRKPFGVRYKVFAGREGRMTTREYWTSSEEKLQRAVDKIQALDNFYEIDGYSYPKESQGVAEAFPNPGSGSTGSSKEDKRIAAALQKKHIPTTPNDKKEKGVAEGSESDAYGNTGEKHECGSCDGTGIDTHDDECPECGGKGWVRDKESSKKKGVAEGSLEELANTSLKVKEPKNFVNTNDRKQVVYKVMKFKSGKDTYLINFTVKSAPAFGKKQNWNALNVAFGVREEQDDYSFGDEIDTDLTAKNKNQFLIYSTVINAVRKFITEYNTEIDEIIMQGAGERQEAMYQRFFQSAGKYFPGWHHDGKHSLVRDVPRQTGKKVKEQGVAEGPQDDPEDYRAHLLKTLPRMMNFLSKNVKGWKPTEEQYLAAIETGYQVMKHTGDVQQAGKAMSDELNTLHRMSQSKSGMMEGSEIKIPTEDGITMQDIRLMAGDGPLTKKTILQAIAVIRKQRRPQGVAEAPKSAAVRLGNAIKRVQGTTAASQARSVIPSSIPKPEPKPQEKQVTKELKTGPAAHFTPKDAHVKRGQFVGGESKKKGADGKACWDGYRYNGTKNGKDSCVKVSEDIENIMSILINKIVVNEAIQNNNR